MKNLFVPANKILSADRGLSAAVRPAPLRNS
jgi:hypothetical protein